MKKVYSYFLTLLTVMILSPVLIFGQKKTAKTFTYGGVATCKACHLSKKSGAQYKIWSESPHAKAYEALKSEEAKAVGKKAGVEEPSTSEKCLKCHTTAFAVDEKLKGPKLTVEEGISCEACHGPGSAYKSMSVMRDIYAGKVDGAQYGLVMPTEEVCVKCHNKESPTFKGFNFKEYAAKIAHPVPKEDK